MEEAMCEIRRSRLIGEERRAARMLLGIAVGMTKVVKGIAVTRWAEDEFEVGSWGVYSEKTAEAAVTLLVTAEL